MEVAILDFSWYGNSYDLASNRLLVGAFAQRGRLATVVAASANGHGPPLAAGKVWLRYDLRQPADLSRVIEVAEGLTRQGVRVFPAPAAVTTAEDKWQTAQVLAKAGVPMPLTRLGSEAHHLPLPVILKRRVGWGSQGICVRRQLADPWPAVADLEAYVAQPFLPHDRTLVAAVAAGRGLACLEDIGGGLQADGRVGTVPWPTGALELAWQALQAVGLPTGTVDLIETADGLHVLEVNSAPRLTYPHLPAVDLAGPMVDAVLAWWEETGL
jgi:glutathione synthase/RimK-type ligase-like ATP-grasp enzyme